MPTLSALRDALHTEGLCGTLAELYGDPSPAVKRLEALCDRFEEAFGGEGELRLFSAPGRVEIGGNHTDHNRGRVLCAAVELDILALVRREAKPRIRLHSEGFPPDEVLLDSLAPRPGEQPSTALIRGICAGIAERGGQTGGFSAVTQSLVHPGSGLSSSAAFENLVAHIENVLYNNGAFPPVELAKIGRYAENVYMGKPSGLMDQYCSAAGGLSAIDFADAENPARHPVACDPDSFGFALCVTGPIGSHAGLNDAYASIPAEMGMVAAALGGKELRDIPPERFYGRLGFLRTTLPERALLRAHHFFAENDRVKAQTAALEQGDYPTFLRLAGQSGASSYQYLQNVVTEDKQALGLAIAESERLLGGEGAVRVHGGGFAGTILAFVPEGKLESYREAMDTLFGEGSCRRLRLRSRGVCVVL